jgi:hypothetical protein
VIKENVNVNSMLDKIDEKISVGMNCDFESEFNLSRSIKSNFVHTIKVFAICFQTIEVKWRVRSM